MFYSNIRPHALKDFLIQPGHDQLKELLLHNTGETDFLDFKWKWIDFTKMAKHILAIANSGGGCIIVGVNQTDDGKISIDGLSEREFLDKADVDNKLENLLPKYLKYHTEDFIFPKRTHALLQGKRFQVMIIEYDPKYVPYTSTITRGELTYGAIYVRQGTKTIEASNDKLVEIILRKAESGGSDYHELSLKEHLNQLKELYEEANSLPNAGYIEFVTDMIEKKKQKILSLLDLQND
ncbi:ATP-binding protein [Bacillus sp. M6-12]|uniref:AlbA family DNA-binding domain-containing protein n=1 Tax=Bacillus sp. M6-12 TaxID=2054166 RepID=UPI000C758D0D|nr:ATP-binding protein [Bacillus sp. M6-12]PLS17070.1 ATP-binding protein [Bacillus sp. M6-12]